MRRNRLPGRGLKMTSIGQPCKTQAWMKAHVAIFLIITCGILTPSYTATSPDDSKNKTSPHQWNQQWDSPHQSVADHSTSVSSRSKFSTRSNVTSSTNGSSSGPLSGLSDLNASLLTDPLYSTTGNNSVAVPITKSSDLVTTALLTAATSLPTGYKSNSSLDTQSSKNISQSYNNTLGQTPILNGSMTIALPTTSSMPAQATQAPTVANGTVSLSSISSNTVLAIVSAGEATPTPTTSTQYVYATGIPGSSGSNLSPSSAPSYVNSSACDLLPSPFSSWAGAGLAFLLLSFL